MAKRKPRPVRSILKSCTDPTPAEIYFAAQAYQMADLSFLPIEADGSKRPASRLLPRVWCDNRGYESPSWKPLTSRQPDNEEVRRWFRRSDRMTPYGLAIIAGEVSSNLEILDLDTEDLVEPFEREVEARAPGLLDRLVQVRTPRPGRHLYYRCREIDGNLKLARIPDPAKEGRRPKTVIETRGEGGYCLAPPSPAECHPREICYQFANGKDFTEICEITPEERQALFGAARALNQWRNVRPERRPSPSVLKKSGSLRPGDDFNQRADWADILQPHGWVYDGSRNDGTEYWTRPGKSEGTSATVDYGGSGLFYVWTSNADPFEEETGYTKFHAFALLEYDGDHYEAAAELKRRGYGRQQRRRIFPDGSRRHTRRRRRR